MRRFYTIILILSLCMLTGCMNAAFTGAQAASFGRHSLRNMLNDHYITMQIDHAIHWNSDQYKYSYININTFNYVVLLTGQVPDKAAQAELTKIVDAVPGVQEVYNLTSIRAPASSLTHISDAWITAKIKSQLVAQNDIDPTQFKVITENGTVYLMGIVQPEQAELATEIAENTEGVQHVVRVFSYLKISKSLK